MAPIVVTIPHTLGKEEALRRLKPALGTASQTFPLLKVHHEVWSGDRVDFKVGALGQMVSGQVTVGEREVRAIERFIADARVALPGDRDAGG